MTEGPDVDEGTRDAYGADLGPQDQALVEALAAGLSARAAGEAAGLSERTVVRKKGDAAFRARLNVRKAEIATDRIAAIQQLRDTKLRLAAQADQALADLLSDEDPDIRFKAAKQLNAATQSLGQLDVQVRLAELERAIAEATGPGWAAPDVWPE